MDSTLKSTDSLCAYGATQGAAIHPRATVYPEEHAHILEMNWSTQYVQLRPGAFRGSLFDVERHGVTVGLEAYNLPMEEMFCAPPGAFFFVRARTLGDAFCEGQSLGREFAMVCTDESFLHFLVQGQYEGSYVAVQGERIDTLLPDFDWRNWMRLQRLCLVNDGQEGRLVGSMRQFLDGVANDGSTLSFPELAEDMAVACASLMEAVGKREQLVPPAHTRAYVFRKAREIIFDQLDQDVTVTKLCKVLRVSERTLEYSFRDFAALGPKRYILTHKLNRVRSDILVAKGQHNVTELAYKWGFSHPSRFAQQYRRHFLELPSQTQSRGANREA